MAQAKYPSWPQASWTECLAELCSCLPASHTFEVGGKGLQRWQALDGHWHSLSHTSEICESYAIHLQQHLS